MDEIVIDELVRSKRKTLALIVMPDGRLVVRAPLRLARAKIESAVAGRADWIRAKQAEAQRLAAETRPKRYEEGEPFWYLGRTYPLRIVNGGRGLRLDGGFELGQAALPRAEQAFQAWYRSQAGALLTQRVAALAACAGLRYSRVRITSARTRWGSCSSRGGLCFTWRLVMAAPEAVDYVVAHELAHLTVRNHGPHFWAEVGRILPGYEVGKRWLRAHARRLTA